MRKEILYGMISISNFGSIIKWFIVVLVKHLFYCKAQEFTLPLHYNLINYIGYARN